MNLISAIEAFNQSGNPPIKMLVTRDGRTVANLPRVGREIVVQGTHLNEKVKVTSVDIALLCQEARLAAAPGLALLEAGLSALAQEHER